MRRTAGVILAGASWSSVFNDSARSGREASDAVASICPTSILGLSRPVCSGPVDFRGSSRLRMVARSVLVGTRYFARSGVPSAQLVVRRLRRGLGGTSGGGRYFRPLVSRRVGNVHQRQRALSHRTSSSILCSRDCEQFSSRVCGQFNSDSLSSQSGGHTIPAAQCHRAVGSVMVGGSSGDSNSTIHHGSPQRLGGLSVSSQSDLRFRVDSQGRSLSGVAEAVAGGHRPVCHLTQSPMLPIFFSIP